MSIQISIIIVNYNVKAFLEQCLYAAYKATKNITSEIIVVDNNSVDDSIMMVKNNFPNVTLVCNQENKGFSFACNQGLRLSSGKYALLLNPDTIIREDSLVLTLEFLENHDDAGALGVKMIDGKGKFLPESKRSLPTTSSAFFKIFGLSKLFPKSKKFGKYQLKYLDKNKIHEVEVLSGAFMLIRKSLLDQIGYLDEDFFMYGEDIDLSYRILKAGYKNYYFPLTTIIHFKGESTKKASLQYVKLFYNAMLTFSKKHYKGKHSELFNLMIKMAIYFRAVISVLYRIIKITFLPVFDFLITYLIYYQSVNIWEKYKFMGLKVYSGLLTHIYIPIYILIWLIFIKYFHGYMKITRLKTLLKALFWGTIFIYAAYSLLPENLRFSRALILIGSVICFISVSSIRLVLRFISNKGKSFKYQRIKNAILLGNINNDSLKEYPKYLDKEFEIKKIVQLEDESLKNPKQIIQLFEIIKVYKIDTIIVFAKNIQASDIINTIMKTKRFSLEYKMILPISPEMISSQSVINLESLPDFKINMISDLQNKIKKRTLDLFVSITLLILSPLFFGKNKPSDFFCLLFKIISNKITWVSYIKIEEQQFSLLPKLKPGVFSPLIMSEYIAKDEKTKFETNLNYAKNYKLTTDFAIILKSLRKTIDLNYHIIK